MNGTENDQIEPSLGVIGLPLIEYCKNRSTLITILIFIYIIFLFFVRADVIITNSPLSSGYSLDVHGQLTISQPAGRSLSSEFNNNNIRLLYRVTETTGVKCCLSR